MKTKILLCCLICIGFFVKTSHAQEASEKKTSKAEKEKEAPYWANSKEVGLNVTPLISKLIPFNIGEKSSGLIGIKTKFYGGGDFAFRMTFGADLGNEDDGFFHAGIGYERRRSLSKRFSYTSGWQTVLESANESGSNTTVFAGVTKFYGLEYNINNSFFIGTESWWLTIWIQITEWIYP